MPKYPTEEELIALDDELARGGVPATRRPGTAWLRWIAQQGIDFSEALAMSDWFEERFAELHPSVDFAHVPFSFLCVSARGIAYEANPPLILATRYANPFRWVKIQGSELTRIETKDPAAYTEMYYQVADCIDLFTAENAFRPKSTDAKNTIAVGTSQLETTSRRLVASSLDASMPQAMCLAVEMIFKAVLAEAGVSAGDLRDKYGHRLPSLAAGIVAKLPGPNDAELAAVAAAMPKYVDVRYNPPRMNANEEQDLFRRALFLCSEALRRTRVSSMYRAIAADATLGARRW